MRSGPGASITLMVTAASAISCASSRAEKPGQSAAGPTMVKPTALLASSRAGCGQIQAALGGTAIGLAAPAGFVEVCTKDEQLCHELTSGYPPTVTTIGYFVPADKWAAHNRGEHPRLGRLLVAQETSTGEDAFPALKEVLRERQGRIPDHSPVIPRLEHVERVDLGVLDEGADFISMGVIINAQVPGLAAVGPQVAINTAFVDRGHVLSLYTHCDFAGPRDEEECRQLTTEWLGCLRGAAQRGVEADRAPPAVERQ